MRRLPDYSGSLPATALERTTTVSRDYTDKALGETEGPAIGHKCRKKEKTAQCSFHLETAQRRSIEMLRLHSPLEANLPPEPFLIRLHVWVVHGKRTSSTPDRPPDRPHGRPPQTNPYPSSNE